MKGCVWYNINGEDAFYTSPTDQNLPDQNNPFGKVDLGYMVDVIGVTQADPTEQWVKFIRKNDAGQPAILWMQRQTTAYGRKVGVVHPHCVEIANPERDASGNLPTSPFSGAPALGQVMCTVASPLYKDSACTQVVLKADGTPRQVMPGELFLYDTETSGVLRSWYEAGGVNVKCYFIRTRKLDNAIGGWLDKIMLVGQSSGAWDEVPVLGKPDEPPPPPPPTGTGCLAWGVAILQKIVDWLKNL